MADIKNLVQSYQPHQNTFCFQHGRYYLTGIGIVSALGYLSARTHQGGLFQGVFGIVFAFAIAVEKKQFKKKRFQCVAK